MYENTKDPLHSLESEKSLLGAIFLTNGKILDDINLNPLDFYSPRHEQMFMLARKMFLNGEPVDVITFVAHIDFKHMKGVGADYVHELTSYVPTAVNFQFYADIIYECAVRRRLVEVSATLMQDAKNIPFTSLTETARSKLDSALGVKQNQIIFVGDEMNETLESMNAPSKAYPTPWTLLTKAIGGFRSGSLYTIGARPGKGKTSIGLQIALELSRGGAVAFSSLEMRRSELHKRIISINANVPMDSTMNNKMSEFDWRQVAQYRSELSPNIAIDDRAEVSVHDIRAFARSVHRVMPLRGVVVDYLQLMSSRDNRPRHEIVAEMSRQLKILARDLDIPVIALSQLNRQSEQRVDKRPSLADLRESGAIEQDSDVVILLHQEDDHMLLDVAKNRQGPPSLVRLHWQGEYARAVS